MLISTFFTSSLKITFPERSLLASLFTFSLITSKAGCGILAFQRFKAGSDTAFNDGLGGGGEDGGAAVPPDGTYGYDDGQYGQAPFTGQTGTEADKF